MSTDLTIDHELNTAAQNVKDQNGNSSSLSLTKEGNVGIGTESPDHTLDVNGTIRIKSSALGKGIFFIDTDFSLGDGSHRFRLQRNFQSTRLRIFEVLLSDPGQMGSFFFDNVDVYPDDDNQQSLGKKENRWSAVHATKGYFSEELVIDNLTSPPPGVQTVDLVIDPETGKIYRKDNDTTPPGAPQNVRVVE